MVTLGRALGRAWTCGSTQLHTRSIPAPPSESETPTHRVDFPQSQREYNPLFFLIYATETRVARHGDASYFPKFR